MWITNFMLKSAKNEVKKSFNLLFGFDLYLCWAKENIWRYKLWQ